MKIKETKFIKSATNEKEYPNSILPEIAFAGRSNVGKSSLINCLTVRRKLAKTSSTPGHTRLINFFDINSKVILVDLPGYGFAKVSKKEKLLWKKIIETYLTSREQLKALVIIMDIRRGPMANDILLLQWCNEIGLPFIPVATKCDNIPKTKLSKVLKVFTDTGLFEESKIHTFSAIKKVGKNELWNTINKLYDRTI